MLLPRKSYYVPFLSNILAQKDFGEPIDHHRILIDKEDKNCRTVASAAQIRE